MTEHDDYVYMPQPGSVEARHVLHAKLKEAHDAGDEAAYQVALAAMKRLVAEPLLKIKVSASDLFGGVKLNGRT